MTRSRATRTAAAVFTVLIGALLFGYFLTITYTPQKVTEFLVGLGIGPYGVLALIMLMYLVLGCLIAYLMDQVSTHKDGWIDYPSPPQCSP